jgi:hypothetical protein
VTTRGRGARFPSPARACGPRARRWSNDSSRPFGSTASTAPTSYSPRCSSQYGVDRRLWVAVSRRPLALGQQVAPALVRGGDRRAQLRRRERFAAALGCRSASYRARFLLSLLSGIGSFEGRISAFGLLVRLGVPRVRASIWRLSDRPQRPGDHAREGGPTVAPVAGKRPPCGGYGLTYGHQIRRSGPNNLGDGARRCHARSVSGAHGRRHTEGARAARQLDSKPPTQGKFKCGPCGSRADRESVVTRSESGR